MKHSYLIFVPVSLISITQPLVTFSISLRNDASKSRSPGPSVFARMSVIRMGCMGEGEHREPASDFRPLGIRQPTCVAWKDQADVVGRPSCMSLPQNKHINSKNRRRSVFQLTASTQAENRLD